MNDPACGEALQESCMEKAETINPRSTAEKLFSDLVCKRVTVKNKMTRIDRNPAGGHEPAPKI